MRAYFVRVIVEHDNGETQEFVTGIEAKDMNDAFAKCATRYTGAGSDWYPTAQLMGLTITPWTVSERI